MDRLNARLIVLLASAGCATGRAVTVTAIPGADPTHVFVVLQTTQPDARAASVWTDLVQSGFVTTETQILEAPATPRALDRLLAKVATAGGTAVLFLRVQLAESSGTMKWWAYPSPIVRSLPLFHERAAAAVEAWVVDPATREILARPARLAARQKRVNGWHYAPVTLRDDLLAQAIQAVLEDVAAASRAGYPERQSWADVERWLFGAPEARQDARRVSTPGLSFTLPPGFELVHQPNPNVVLAEAPNGVSIQLSLRPTYQGAEDFGDLERDRHPVLIADEPSVLGDRPARAFETVEDGDRVLLRVTTLGGFGFTVRCAGPAEALGRAPELCDDLFDSVQIDRLAVTEP